MKKDRTQIQLNSKWTKRLALVMSVLYLVNPLHQPLNFILHEFLEVFESTNKVIGYETNFRVDQVINQTDHGHEVMQLKSAHNIIDFVSQVLETSSEDDLPHHNNLEDLKIDKHIVSFKIKMERTKLKESTSIFWLLKEKVKKGHLVRFKEPPQLS